MTVAASTLTAAATTPADERALRAPVAAFQPDWSEPLRVVTRWRTARRAARSTAEQRRRQRDKPRHELVVPLPAMGGNDAVEAAMVLSRAADARSLAPLWPDQTQLTAAASASATTLACDTTYRRLSAGARVLVIEPRRRVVAQTWEVATIDALTDTSITLDAGLVSAYTAAARVVPLIEAEVGLSQDARLGSNRTGAWGWRALERVGPMTLDPVAAPGSLPAGFDTHDDGTLGELPILDLPCCDWARGLEAGLARVGTLETLGQGEVPEVLGPRAALRFGFDVLALGRAKAWAIKSFFDSRAGSCYPFYACTPMTYDLDAVASTSRLDVAAVGDVDDWGRRPLLFVLETDGTAHVRGVSSVTRVGGVDQVTLDAAISPLLSAANIRLVGWAVLGRFDTDELAETWVTDGQMSASLSVVELPVEKEVTIAGLNVLQTAPACSDAGVEVIAYTKAFNGSAIGSNAFYRGRLVADQPLATTRWAAQTGNGQFDSLGGQGQQFEPQNLSYDASRGRFHFTSGTGIVAVYDASSGAFIKGWRADGSEWDGEPLSVGSTLNRYGGHTYDAGADVVVAIDGAGSSGTHAIRVDLSSLTIERQTTGIVQFYPRNAVYDGADYVYTGAANSGGRFRGHSFEGNADRVLSITGWLDVLFYCKTHGRLVCLADPAVEPAGHNVLLVDPVAGVKTAGIAAASTLGGGASWSSSRRGSFCRLSETRFVIAEYGSPDGPYTVFDIGGAASISEAYDWRSLVPGSVVDSEVLTAVDATRFLFGVVSNETGATNHNLYLADTSAGTATFVGAAASIAGEDPDAGGDDDFFEMMVTAAVAI
ncbi:MAG: hypothetical protein AAGI54_04110 [Planctomycetota bacterium]